MGYTERHDYPSTIACKLAVGDRYARLGQAAALHRDEFGLRDLAVEGRGARRKATTCLSLSL